MNRLLQRRKTLALAESCTGGLVSYLLSGISGASNVLWGSFVCYTREAKTSMLHIDLTGLDLVSRQTAEMMAKGARNLSAADIAAAVTGLAGPLGDGTGVPVGTVWIALSEAEARQFVFSGSRNEVRLQAAIMVLEYINEYLTNKE